MNILLAYKANAAGAGDPHTALLPVGLASINAVLRGEGHKSKIANLSRYNWQHIARIMSVAPPDVLGVSQFTHNRFESIRLALLAKEANPACFVIFGGPHATGRFHELLSQNRAIDAVVLGEGEETFCELVKALPLIDLSQLHNIHGIAFRSDGAVVKTPPRPPVADLDALPMAASCFDDALGADSHRQLEFIITSRGCPASCTFCSSPAFWGKSLRFRSPTSIVEEIRFIRDHYGLIYYSIRDDTFTADRERVIQFCRLLLQERVHILWNCQSRVNAVDEEMLAWMKRAGCECVQFGVESGSARVLKSLGKGIAIEQIKKAALAVRNVGIQLSLYLITGVPGEGEEDLRETLALLSEIKAHDAQVSPLAYYPGTRLFEQGVRSGAVAADLFEADLREALYVRSDPFVAYSIKALLAKVARVAKKSCFTGGDFLLQKKRLGYCHATNVMAGEMYESVGQWRKAEEEYREITLREPENPWGWLMLGELYVTMEKLPKARQAFQKLSRICPAHAPAFSSLGELYRIAGDYKAAAEHYQRALELDPLEKTVRAGLKLMER